MSTFSFDNQHPNVHVERSNEVVKTYALAIIHIRYNHTFSTMILLGQIHILELVLVQ